MDNELDRIDPRVLGERLRHARTRAGLTQGQAAARLKIARTTVIAIEKGQRRVAAEELRAFVVLYACSVNSLLRPSAVRVDLVPRFRAIAPTSEAISNAARLLNDLASAEVELERMLGRVHRFDYPPERPLMLGDPREQGEEAALAVRHRLGIGLAPVSDIVSLLELELGMRVFLRRLPSPISGLFAFDDELGACMLLNASHVRQRRALTAAHETGHFFASRRQPNVVESTERNATREERFAAAFAASFMMPAPTVRRYFQEVVQEETDKFSLRHLILLAHTLHVSSEAACRRLEELGLVRRGRWESLKERGFSEQLVRQALGDQPSSDSPSLAVPPRLWFLAAEVYGRGILSEEQLADMLRMDRVEVREMLDALQGDEGNEDQPLPAR